mmetsp:Transcript_108851/g.303501  ORF Transcript_108851/g.303501 Transcript_108851/m.303501 type:complete len:393 (+) Transcript_108851:60-1238(+)
MPVQGMLEGLLAQLWRDASGNAVFMEAGAEFVSALQCLLKQPLGAVLGACNEKGVDESWHPLLALALSATKIWAGSHGIEEVGVLGPLDWSAVLQGGSTCQADYPDVTRMWQQSPHKQQHQHQHQQQHWQDCLRCLKEFGQRRLVPPGSYCEYCNAVWTPGAISHSLLQNVSCYCPGCGVEAAVDATTGSCSECKSQRVCTFGQVLAWPHCAKCTSTGYDMSCMDEDRVCIECGGSGSPTCARCECCDACSLAQLGYAPPGVPFVACREGPSLEALRRRFLITNRFEVVEACTEKVTKLAAAAGCDVERMSVQPVLVTPERLRKLVLRALLGSAEVLECTFPPRVAGAAGERACAVDEGVGRCALEMEGPEHGFTLIQNATLGIGGRTSASG